MKVEHYGWGAGMKAEAGIKFPISTDISGKKVLIVDDITDTGETLRLSVDYVQSLKPAEIRTAVLQHKTCSSFVPDFYGQKKSSGGAGSFIPGLVMKILQVLLKRFLEMKPLMSPG